MFHLLPDHVQFTLIGNIPGSCVILFFTASDLTFTTRHIHNWVLYLLCPNLFIHSGAIGNSPPLLPSSILNIFRLGGLIFQCLISLSFYTVHEVLTANILGWFAIPSSSGREWEDTWAEESHIILKEALQAVYSLLESKWRKLTCRWRMTISFEEESIIKLN